MHLGYQEGQPPVQLKCNYGNALLPCLPKTFQVRGGLCLCSCLTLTLIVPVRNLDGERCMSKGGTKRESVPGHVATETTRCKRLMNTKIADEVLRMVC